MAAGDIKIAYGSSAAFTVTLLSLASSSIAGVEATHVNNATNKYLDAMVQIKFSLANSTLGNDSAIYVYAYGAETAGNFETPATGADSAIADCTSFRMIGVKKVAAVTTPQWAGPFSVASVFGGIMPIEWGIIVRNFASAAFHSTASLSAANYTEVYATAAQS